MDYLNLKKADMNVAFLLPVSIIIDTGNRKATFTSADTEAAFSDLHLLISNCFVSSKIYGKRDHFDLNIVNFSFLDGNVPHASPYGVYVSQLIRLLQYLLIWLTAKLIEALTAKILLQLYRYYKIRKTVSKLIVDTAN